MKTQLCSIAKLLVFSLISSFAFCPNATADEMADNFATAELAGRIAERGDWKFAENTATCVADPELYKKYNNHGPIIKWEHDLKEGVVEMEFKATGCQRVVFTLNGEGHIFRVILMEDTKATAKRPSAPASRILAWAEKSSKENKGDSFKPDGLPALTTMDGKWVKVKLTVKGEQANLSIGDFKTEIKHAALAREKNLVMLSFAEGEIAVRNFRVETP